MGKGVGYSQTGWSSVDHTSLEVQLNTWGRFYTCYQSGHKFSCGFSAANLFQSQALCYGIHLKFEHPWRSTRLRIVNRCMSEPIWIAHEVTWKTHDTLITVFRWNMGFGARMFPATSSCNGDSSFAMGQTLSWTVFPSHDMSWSPIFAVCNYCINKKVFNRRLGMESLDDFVVALFFLDKLEKPSSFFFFFPSFSTSNHPMFGFWQGHPRSNWAGDPASWSRRSGTWGQALSYSSWCPQDSVLVGARNSNFTRTYGRYIELVNGIINQLITGGGTTL